MFGRLSLNPSALKLIVGLGNPGKEYTHHRHNIGHWFIHRLQEAYPFEFKLRSKFFGHVGEATIEHQKCWVLLPDRFMNESGVSVQAVQSFYSIDPENILVVHDELDLPPGVIRLKQNGGDGGHRGLRSIVEQIGSKAFYRLRIGIGHPGHKDQVHRYVLSNVPKVQQPLFHRVLTEAVGYLPDLVAGRYEKVMKAMHTKKTEGQGDGI